MREALCRLDRVKWQAAIEAEVGSCMEYGAWETCDLCGHSKVDTRRVCWKVAIDNNES
jgi:hypothetical protein